MRIFHPPWEPQVPPDKAIPPSGGLAITASSMNTPNEHAENQDTPVHSVIDPTLHSEQSEPLHWDADKENRDYGIQEDDSDAEDGTLANLNTSTSSSSKARKKSSIVLTQAQKAVKKAEEEAALAAIQQLRQNVSEAIELLAREHHQWVLLYELNQ